MKRVLIIDLEATCWRRGKDYRYNETEPPKEIIEIGAAIYDLDENKIVSTFQRFVRPIEKPVISDFCNNLTTITQDDINNAENLPMVLRDLLQWAKDHGTTNWWGSWGNYDRRQFDRECSKHQITNIINELNHTNIKQLFAEALEDRPMGVGRAIEHIGKQFIGTAHRGIDDAINVCYLLEYAINKKGKEWVMNYLSR